ncbi:MAG: hypothetical protein AAFY48_04490 [Bacteroidota bacterium]
MASIFLIASAPVKHVNNLQFTFLEPFLKLYLKCPEYYFLLMDEYKELTAMDGQEGETSNIRLLLQQYINNLQFQLSHLPIGSTLFWPLELQDEYQSGLSFTAVEGGSMELNYAILREGGYKQNRLEAITQVFSNKEEGSKLIMRREGVVLKTSFVLSHLQTSKFIEVGNELSFLFQ